ncbi:MAG: NifX-associated nitrogen fixation protein [Pseudomonadota bacterium]
MSVAELIIEKADVDAAGAFVGELVRQMRAVDTYGILDSLDDVAIVDPFIMTKERRREIPVIGDPDDITMSRVKCFYNALAVMIEQRSGLMASPLVSLSHEGFGRALITVGKLIVLERALRDVHRFGFPSLKAMEEEAEKLVGKATALIEAHRDVAKL